MDFWITEILRPLIAVSLSILIPLLIGAVWRFIERQGWQIDAAARAALETALHNAALLIIARMGGRTAVQSAVHIAREEGVRYVIDKVPDTVKRFGLTHTDIDEKLIPKIEEELRK